MLIVDAQVHIWSNAIPTNAAHRQIPTNTTGDLLRDMDDSGINAAVIHPPPAGTLIPASLHWMLQINILTGYRSWGSLLLMIPIAAPWSPIGSNNLG